jgi:hypothetical protein
MRWPLIFLNEKTDGKGAYYGSKSTTLESVGLLLPFLCVPTLVAGKEVVLEVDNIALWYGWNSKSIPRDASASILIRALHLLSFKLGCIVHIKHVLRRSTAMSELADDLSRRSTTRTSDLEISGNGITKQPPAVLKKWIEDPKEDWNLAIRIVDSVEI